MWLGICAPPTTRRWRREAPHWGLHVPHVVCSAVVLHRVRMLQPAGRWREVQQLRHHTRGGFDKELDATGLSVECIASLHGTVEALCLVHGSTLRRCITKGSQAQ